MNRQYIKSEMFFSIMMMSVVIFTLAYSAFFLAYDNKEKDIGFFSDDYIICQFDGSPKIGEILDTIAPDKYLHIAFIDEYNKYKIINYTDELFSFLQLDVSKYKDKLENAIGNMIDYNNFALVNAKYKSQCYLQGDMYLINIFGETYNVLDFYHPNEDDEYTVCYINAWGEHMKNIDMYSCLVIDPNIEKELELKNDVEKLFSDVNISQWNGKVQGLIYFNDIYFYVVLLCGIILCINCSNFTDMWVKSYKEELTVRKLVGANDFKIHLFIIKEYLKLFLAAGIVGAIVAQGMFSVFKYNMRLVHVRAIFGTSVTTNSVLLAFGSVLLITITVLEFRFKYLMKKQS